MPQERTCSKLSVTVPLHVHPAKELWPLNGPWGAAPACCMMQLPEPVRTRLSGMCYPQGMPHGSSLARALAAREAYPCLAPRCGEGVKGLSRKGPAGSPASQGRAPSPTAPSLCALISSLFLSLLSCEAGSCIYLVLKCQSSSS